jgi:WD40 repeat protein
MSQGIIRQIYYKKSEERQENFLGSILTLYIRKEEFGYAPDKDFQKAYKLLINLDFLDIKCNHSKYGLQKVIEDFNGVTSQINSDSNLSEEQIQALQIIRDALVLSVDILEKNPDQLVAQLLGRLMYFTQPEIVRLVQQVENHPAPYLVPRNSVLTPPTQKLVRTLQGHEDSKVAALITVPFTQEFEQSFLIVSGGEDGLIKIWDGLSGNLHQTLGNHRDSITALTITQDGKYIFSGAADGEIIIWQVNVIDEQKIELKALHSQVLSHDADVKALVISANQKLLFVASGQKIYVYEWQSNNLVVILKGHTGVINCLLCDRANQNFYSGSDDGLIYIWDMQNYQHIGTLKPKPERNEGYRQRMAGKLNSVLSMCFVRHTDIAAIFRDGLVHEFNILKRQETRNYPFLTTISYKDFYNVANGYICSFSRYEFDIKLEFANLVIAAGNSFAIGESKEILRSNKSNVYNSLHNNLFSAFCISPDEKYAISGEKEIKIWWVSTAIENEIVVTPAHNKPITHIQIAPDKNICISASDDFGRLRVWNLFTLTELWDHTIHDLEDIIFPEENSDIFAVISKDESVGFNIDNGELVFLQKWDSSYTLPRIFLRYERNKVEGSIFAFISDKKFAFTMRIDEQLVNLYRGEHLNKITSLTVSPIQIASGSDGIIQLSDTERNQGAIYLADKVKPKSLAFVYYNHRLLTWLSDDSIVIYDGLIDEEDLGKNLDNINPIFKTKGRGYQLPNSGEYIIPISKERRAVAIYREYEGNESFIEVRELEFGDFLQRIRVDVPNLVSWQFDLDFDADNRYLIGVYDPSSKPESNPVAKNLIVWDLRTKKKCCEFVNDLEITSYRMSSKLESVIVGDAGGRLHFLQFTSEHTKSINLHLYEILNPEYLTALKSRDVESINLHLNDSEYQRALKNMIDLDSYEAPRFIEKYYDTDKIYAESWSNFFKSIFYLFRFDYPKFIEHIKQFSSGINSASSITERFEKENIKNAEIVISYDPNNYEAYWIKGKIYLKQAKSFFEKKLYKQGLQAVKIATANLDKAETLGKKSSKVNNTISELANEADKFQFQYFFWQPITKIAESYDFPLETETDIRAALRITNSMISLTESSKYETVEYNEYVNIPDLLPKAYIYKAKLNLMLRRDIEALKICNLALECKPNGDDSKVIYGIMADAYELQDNQDNRQLARKYRRKSKSITDDQSVVQPSLWSWRDQWQNNPNLDDRIKFFMVKIVAPIRVFLFYFIPWIILMYLLYPPLKQPLTDLIMMTREYISHILNTTNKK